MLPFFARTLTRREMALGCAVLSLALLLSALPAALRWGQALWINFLPRTTGMNS